MLARLAGPAAALVRRARRALARRQHPAAAIAPLATAHTADLVTERAAELRQPDQTSCGASSLVFARMLRDPAYATSVMAEPDGWRRAVLAMHRRVSGLRDHDGRLQWPWPRFVGTSPWAAARQLGGGAGRSGTGPRYGWRMLDPDDLGTEFDRILAAVRSGHTVPLYVGNELRPAHVVLVVSAEDDRLRVYEPSAGRMLRVGRDAFSGSTFGLGGWSVPWFAVLPR